MNVSAGPETPDFTSTIIYLQNDGGPSFDAFYSLDVNGLSGVLNKLDTVSAIGGGAIHGGINLDGDKLYVFSRDGGEVYRYDIDSGNYTQLITGDPVIPATRAVTVAEVNGVEVLLVIDFNTQSLKQFKVSDIEAGNAILDVNYGSFSIVSGGSGSFTFVRFPI